MEDNFPQIVWSDRRWSSGGYMSEALLAHPLLTSCCVAQFLTQATGILVHSLGVGNPYISISFIYAWLFCMVLWYSLSSLSILITRVLNGVSDKFLVSILFSSFDRWPSRLSLLIKGERLF